MGVLHRCMYVGVNEDYFDIQIGPAFIHRWRQYKTGGTIEHNQLVIRVTRDIAELFGLKQLEINSSDDGPAGL
jgi:hypothetical protein